MTRNLSSRIRRLEDRMRVVGCATCREWDAPAAIEIMTEEEAAANPLPHIPDACPTCGRTITHTIRRITITQRPDGPQ